MVVPQKPLERYALILDILSRRPEGLSLTEITRQTGLPKGTAHRLVRSLGEIGYVAGGGARAPYRLGSRLVRMLHAGETEAAAAQLVQPILRALVDEFDETAFLAKLVGVEVRKIAQAMPRLTDRSHMRPGMEMPPNAAASAKAIVAFQETDVIERILDAKPLVRYAGSTCVVRADLHRQYADVRDAGYALCVDELDPGVMSVAVPVAIRGAGVIYSVGIVGILPRLSRFPRNNLVTALRTAAERIADLLSNGRGRLVHRESTAMTDAAQM